MVNISSELSGTSTAECFLLRDIDDIEATDFFLISRQILSSVGPTRKWMLRDQILTNEIRSMRSSYDVLSNSILEDLKGICKLGSMAYESSADYSIEGHVHQYSHLSVVPTIKRSDYDDASQILALATFNINGKKSVLYSPKSYSSLVASQSLTLVKEPCIGQLKFLGIEALPKIDESAKDFDGWIYPDGREVSREAFAEAFKTFGEDYGSGDGEKTFNIPALSNFLKPIVANSSGEQDIDRSEIVPALMYIGLPKKA